MQHHFCSSPEPISIVALSTSFLRNCVKFGHALTSKFGREGPLFVVGAMIDRPDPSFGRIPKFRIKRKGVRIESRVQYNRFVVTWLESNFASGSNLSPGGCSVGTNIRACRNTSEGRRRRRRRLVRNGTWDGPPDAFRLSRALGRGRTERERERMGDLHLGEDFNRMPFPRFRTMHRVEILGLALSFANKTPSVEMERKFRSSIRSSFAFLDS